MADQTGYRFLDPQALARVKNLSLVARGVVEGFISGLHSSPYKGFSAEFAEHREYTAGDDPAAHRLSHVGPHRSPLRQAVRGRDQHAGADPPGHQRLDGLQLRAAAYEARVRLLFDGDALLLDDAAAGLRRADRLRHGGAAGHARPQLPATSTK